MKSPKHATKLTPVAHLDYRHIRFIHGCIQCPKAAQRFYWEHMASMRSPEEVQPIEQSQRLTPEQAELLYLIGCNRQPSIATLQRQTGMSQRLLQALIDTLAAQGLVRKQIGSTGLYYERVKGAA